MKHLLPLLAILALAGSAQAQDRYWRNGVFYERTKVPYTAYSSYGRPYTAYKFVETVLTSYKDPNWRVVMLNLLHQKNEADAFQKAVELVAPAQPQYGGYASAQAALYPSQTGATLGGFSRVEYSSLGAPLNGDSAGNRIAGLIDSFNRASADNARQGDVIHSSVASLIDKEGDRVGAVLELQETRATVRELSTGMAAMTASMAEALKAMKPSPSERFSAETQTGTVRTESKIEHTIGTIEQPTVFSAQATGDQQAVVKTYCHACHSGEAAKGGFVFDLGQPLSREKFADVYIRMDPKSPAQTSGGKLFRMPPESAAQPSVEERRLIVQAAQALVSVE